MTDTLFSVAETAETENLTIPGVAEWFADQPILVQEALVALGDLLSNRTNHAETNPNMDEFIEQSLSVKCSSQAVHESRNLGGALQVSVGLAITELLDEYQPTLGPGMYRNPAKWASIEIADDDSRHVPVELSARFEGTLVPDVTIIVRLNQKESSLGAGEVGVYVRPEHHAAGIKVLDRIMKRANELNPFRGRVLRAEAVNGLSFAVLPTPTVARADVIVPDDVWTEVDLNVAAVRDHHEMLTQHGLGVRRGVMLVGPPGTGKSALSAAVAGELVGDGFTVIYVDSRAGASLLTQVMDEAQRLEPTVVILEDVDLYIRQRSMGSGYGLSELLQAMDIRQDSRILTLASTNDAQTLDAAATRPGRFDAILEIGYPAGALAERIVATLIDGVPGAESVDTTVVAAALPPQTSGAGIREIVRRAVLTTGGELDTATLVEVARSGRWRPKLPESGGHYL